MLASDDELGVVDQEEPEDDDPLDDVPSSQRDTEDEAEHISSSTTQSRPQRFHHLPSSHNEDQTQANYFDAPDLRQVNHYDMLKMLILTKAIPLIIQIRRMSESRRRHRIAADNN